jgi:hypothetical protein
MPRRSPFAGVDDGPAEDAVVVALGGPTRTALGCFGLTTLFVALVAVGALSYAIVGTPGPPNAPASLHVVAGVLGGLFLLMVVGLASVAVRATRRTHGLAFTADAVWCRPERALVRLSWSEIATVRVVAPEVRGARTSTPRTPSVELTPVDEAVARRHPALVDSVTSGAPVEPGCSPLRFTFRLSSAEDGATVAAAVDRFAPDKWRE